MKKILVTCSLVLACGFGAAALAQNADVSATATGNADVAIGTRPVPAPGDRNCLRDTGSHIPPPKGGCLPVTGRSYNHDELQRTGQPDVGRALQQLDPAVQVTGH